MPGPGSYLISEDEKEYVNRVIDSKYLFRYGDYEDSKFTKSVYTLEQKFSNYIGVDYCVATVSGTMALVNALKTLGIGDGDEVLVPGYTYVASFSAVISVGAIPVLTEINESLTIDIHDIENKITKKTKCIMPVHMIGNPCDMDSILEIAQNNNLFVIEDCCQAAGAIYKGKKVGSFGDFAAFSLNFYKTITAGDGGLLVTNNKENYERAFAFHDQGHKPNRASSAIGDRNIIGLNLRMNELTGAVALAQLNKIEFIVDTLRTKKSILKNNLNFDKSLANYRILNDADGECGSIMTIVFFEKTKAKEFAKKLNTMTVSKSGWHVYSNMEHINNFLKEVDYPNSIGALPVTDDILDRAVNVSIGVVDEGLGSGFGINILSSEDEIISIANQINNAMSNL